jgi:4-oxalocrotonate tautomerase
VSEVLFGVASLGFSSSASNSASAIVISISAEGFLRTYLSDRCQIYFEVECMPIVQVSVWEGITSENKKKAVEGITKVFEDMGVPREAVHIVIYEEPKGNWATGGVLHSEKHAQTPSL